ncbi:hypothetical protein PG984_013870 [Apiospora sp. TS-2023a]
MTNEETNEGGERIRAIKTLGDDKQNDYLDEEIVITRLASENTEGIENPSFRKYVKYAMFTCTMKEPIAVLAHRNHPGLKKLGFNTEGNTFAIMG